MMFHTNYFKLEEHIHCDDDCDWGGCKGHLLELIIINTAGVACLKLDGDELLWLDCNMAEAIYKMMTKLKE